MSPLRFRYLHFDQPLLSPEEWSGREALLLFPGEAGRNAARRLLQPGWELTGLRLLTLEEFKEQLFIAPSPLLKEEKRTLAFYASLDTTARDQFRIASYFQCIELANHFFALLEEAGESLVDLDAAPNALAEAGAELLPWQEKSLRMLLHIRDLYRDFINQRGFSDRIFIRRAEHIDDAFCAPFREIILVNPFQLSPLEKSMLHLLAGRGHEITCIFQLPPRLMDEEALKVRPFLASELGATAPCSITLHQCGNDFALYARFIESAALEHIPHAVDVSLQPNAFHHLFSPARFRLPASFPMSETSLYHFFATLGALLEELVWESQAGCLLLPLPALLEAAHTTAFYQPLLEHVDPDQGAAERERLITLLHKLQEQDYLYLDLQGRFFNSHHRERRELEPLVRPVLRLLESLLEVQDPAGFVRLLSDPEQLPLRRIVPEKERSATTLIELFYQSLADFSALGELGLIEKWHTLFPGEGRSTTVRGLVRLYLDYIKSMRVRFEWNTDRQNQIEFISFADAQQLTFERLALLQVVEGQLPRTRAIPWLLTEQQRVLLGLTTSDDIHLREKYAFFRLALSTPELHLFTVENTDKNTQPSSFVEELALAFPQQFRMVTHPDIDYRDFSRQFFSDREEVRRPLPVRDQGDYFTLPFDAAADFPAGMWRLSYYTWEQLKSNPFEYALRTVAGVPDWPGKWPMEWTHKLLGKVAQELFDLCWHYYIKESAPFSSFAPLFDDYGDRAIADLFSSHAEYYFKLPKNHGLVYFREFVLPVIRSSGAYFFQQLHTRFHLDADRPRVFPEKEFTSARETSPQLYMTAAESGLPLDLFLTGRADLRIENGEPMSAFLIDYKTGSQYKEEQLLIYELLYYLLDDPGMADRVRSCFYKILEQRFDKLNKNTKKLSKLEHLAKFRGEIANTLLQLCTTGYQPARRRSWGGKNIDDIIRLEIFHPR